MVADVVDLVVQDLFESSYGRLVNAAALLLRDRASAEDVVQDVLARCLDTWDRHGLPEDPERYVTVAVMNRSRSTIRRIVTERRHAPSRPMSVEGADAALSGRDEVLEDALSRLPRRQRECLVSRFVLDLSIAQSAEALGISAGSVKTHTSRGLLALRGLMSDSRDSEKEHRHA